VTLESLKVTVLPPGHHGKSHFASQDMRPYLTWHRYFDASHGTHMYTSDALQIQDRSPQSRPVASRNQSQTHSDATGLNCCDRSWICNAPHR